MAAAATDPAQFPLFSNLPTELRDQIWHAALPDKVQQALYAYKKGCWCPHRLSAFEEGYDHENDEYNLKLEFRHGLLDHVRIDLPLLFVNREARTVALAWVRDQQGIEIHPCENGQNLILACPFDPKRDALYVALDKWDDFICEPDERLLQTDLFG